MKYPNLPLIFLAVASVFLFGCGGDSGTVESPDAIQHLRGMKEMADDGTSPSVDPNAVVAGAKATGISGTFTPADLYAHYSIPGTTGVPINGSTAGNGGAGTTIAIVDAPGSSTITADLKAFNTRFGLPQLTSCTSTSTALGAACAASTTPYFTIIDQSGGKTNAGWAGEIALDVEWAHAFAPKANILLVIAKSSSIADMVSAAALAAQQANVVAVSMSFGAIEFASETFYDTTFKNAIANQGVVFLASTGDAGDWGSNKSYPAASTYVTAVGGTAIKTTGETAWSLGGGGPAIYQKMPSYQSTYQTTAGIQLAGKLSTNVATTGPVIGALRAMPDVSFNADPTNSPVLVVNGGKLQAVGGTSESAPLWAGVVAQLASQTGVTAFKSRIKSAAGGYGFNSLLYSPAKVAASFSDVTVGTNFTTGGSSACLIFCTAAVGYDDVTGLGVPIVSAFLSAYR
jgi:subtilase family serine protease